MKIDLHNHSNYSDGAWSVKKLLDKAKSRGVDIIALTDHDGAYGVPEAIEYGASIGIGVVGGIEITSYYNGEPIHVLGYFKDNIVPKEINEYAAGIIEKRKLRAKTMMGLIEKYYYLNVDYDHLFSSGKVLTRGNMMRTLVYSNPDLCYDKARFYISNESKAYIPASKTSTKEAIELLHSVGAQAVLAHPVLVKNSPISELLDFGFDGIEARYPDNGMYDEQRFRTLASKYNIFWTSGSDCHGDASHAIVGVAVCSETIFSKLAEKINYKL